MSYAVLKALHIVFVVTWFAGLFYIVRLLIYIQEAHDKPANERDVLLPQLKLMSRRLWKGITWPSAILTAILGTSLVWSIPGYLQAPWMHLKLTLVALLFAITVGPTCWWASATLTNARGRPKLCACGMNWPRCFCLASCSWWC